MGEGLRQQLSSALSTAEQHKATGQALAQRAAEMRLLLGSILDHIAQGTGLAPGSGTGAVVVVSVLPPSPPVVINDSVTTTSATSVPGSLPLPLLQVEEAAVAAAKGQVTALAQGLADVTRGKQTLQAAAAVLEASLQRLEGQMQGERSNTQQQRDRAELAEVGSDPI